MGVVVVVVASAAWLLWNKSRDRLSVCEWCIIWKEQQKRWMGRTTGEKNGELCDRRGRLFEEYFPTGGSIIINTII